MMSSNLGMTVQEEDQNQSYSFISIHFTLTETANLVKQ